LSVESCDIFARIRDLKVATELTAALRAGQVDSEHVFKLVELGCVFCAAGDRDGCAVHIKLWLSAQLRHPAPCQSGLTVGDFWWNGVVPGICAAVGIVDWTAANPAGDCFECAFGGRSSVQGYA